MSIPVLYEFMEYLWKFEFESGTIYEFVEGRIVIPASLDAFNATAVTCHRSEGTDYAGGQRQNI